MNTVKTNAEMRRRFQVGRSLASRIHNAPFAILAMCLIAVMVSPGWAQKDLVYYDGPVMRPTTVFLIFWLPPGTSFDSSVPGGIGNYETVTARFFGDVAGTSYFNILTQYPGICGGATNCLAGPITVGGTFVDTSAYPHAGTNSDPLMDSDIQAEITKTIAAKAWTAGMSAEFFVFTAKDVQECAGGLCTFRQSTFGDAFCAYHSSFITGGAQVLYAFMPDVDSLGNGCHSGVSKSPNGQASTDREIVVMSHEFFETITDPIGSSQGWIASDVQEIGDNCTGKIGNTNSAGSNVTLGTNPYVVQEMWSNSDGNCVLGLTPAVAAGPWAEFLIETEDDDLRDNSTATASLGFLANPQAVTLKANGQPTWGNNSYHVRVFGINQPQPSTLGNVSITLASSPGFGQGSDQWNLHAVDVKLRDATGMLLCEQDAAGSPLVKLTKTDPTATFPTPNCMPPPPPQEGVVCSVFDDGYTNLEGPSDAVYFRTDANWKTACIPGTGPGRCHKWFGRCVTQPSGVSVYFNTFEDGYANLEGNSDAVYIRNDANETRACIPGNGPGRCHKWFGRGTTADGRSVTCSIFEDGYTLTQGPSDAIFVNRPQNGMKSCMPSGTATGFCHKWFGRCTAQ